MYFQSLIHRMDGENVHKENHLNESIPSEMDQNQDPKRKSESGDKSVEPPNKRVKIGRFQVEDTSSKWKLSEELADYAIKNFNTYLSDKQIEDSILQDFPPPSNVKLSKELDPHMKRTVEEKHDKQNKTFPLQGLGHLISKWRRRVVQILA